MNRPNVRSFAKAVREMKTGDTLYVNAISCSKATVDLLRQYIKDGILAPSEEWLQRAIKEGYRQDYITGISIAPQMDYIKR